MDDIAQVLIWMWMSVGGNLRSTEGRACQAFTHRGQRPCRARQGAPSSPQMYIETYFSQCPTKYRTAHTVTTELLLISADTRLVQQQLAVPSQVPKPTRKATFPN